MKVFITICLGAMIGAVFANPISYSGVSVSSELDSNTTESVSVSQSSENDTSELQSSEENSSSQSQSSESESESLESTSEDKTMAETSDNSMGSEENVRKNWVQVFSSVIKDLSAEDNSSAEVKDQSDHLTEKQRRINTAEGHINLPLVKNPTDSSDTASDSADTSNSAAPVATPVTSDSSESSSSESNETSNSSDSSEVSKSSEESNASDSTELEQIKTQDCVNGTQSCESEEYFFQDIGDDAHYSVDNLMVPDEDERELSLRR